MFFEQGGMHFLEFIGRWNSRTMSFEFPFSIFFCSYSISAAIVTLTRTQNEWGTDTSLCQTEFRDELNYQREVAHKNDIRIPPLYTFSLQNPLSLHSIFYFDYPFEEKYETDQICCLFMFLIVDYFPGIAALHSYILESTEQNLWPRNKTQKK